MSTDPRYQIDDMLFTPRQWKLLTDLEKGIQPNFDFPADQTVCKSLAERGLLKTEEGIRNDKKMRLEDKTIPIWSVFPKAALTKEGFEILQKPVLDLVTEKKRKKAEEKRIKEEKERESLEKYENWRKDYSRRLSHDMRFFDIIVSRLAFFILKKEINDDKVIIVKSIQKILDRTASPDTMKLLNDKLTVVWNDEVLKSIPKARNYSRLREQLPFVDDRMDIQKIKKIIEELSSSRSHGFAYEYAAKNYLRHRIRPVMREIEHLNDLWEKGEEEIREINNEEYRNHTKRK